MSQIDIFRGNDHVLDLVFDDGGNPASAIDITGYTFLFAVKRKTDIKKDDSAALITKDVTTHSDPTNGISEIELTDSDTDLEPDTYIYGVTSVDASGDRQTVKVGDFVITDDPNKR